MRIQTQGNSTTVWLCSDIGVIDGTMTMSAPILEKILQAVNEKYGTSFESWSQLPTAFEVGDTVPNWNAYEKIEMPQPFLWKMNLQGASVLVFGKVENNILLCYSQTIQRALVADENGLIISGMDVDKNFFTSLVKPKLDVLGISYTSVAYDTSTYTINDNVENWGEYTELS